MVKVCDRNHASCLPVQALPPEQMILCRRRSFDSRCRADIKSPRTSSRARTKFRGLGHIAVQYARAMGLRVVAVDIDDSKLALATRLGAEVAVNARTSDVVAEVQKATGGVHGVLVTAVHPQAFGQAIGLVRRGGTIVFNGLPPGDFPAPIFDIVLKGLTIRGSIVGTRQDMAEALDFYARGLIHPTVASASLDDINDVFGQMERGQIDGRIVIDYRSR